MMRCDLTPFSCLYKKRKSLVLSLTIEETRVKCTTGALSRVGTCEFGAVRQVLYTKATGTISRPPRLSAVDISGDTLNGGVFSQDPAS